MPEWEEFTTPAYKLETVASASARHMNTYLELVEKGPRAGKLRFRSIPGLSRAPFATLPDSPMRGLLRIDGGNRLFAVAGSSVFEVLRDGTFSRLDGEVAASSHPALMTTNGFQLAIASGGQGYLVEGGNPVGTVRPINFTDGTPLRAATIDFMDQYFIAAEVDSKNVRISGLAPDGGTWDPGDAKIKEGYPDNIARVFCDNQQLWLFGFDSAEPWIDTGALFPFERQGVVLKIGTSAPYSVAGAKGYRFWLWQGAVYGAYGINPETISDYGVEQAIKTYGDTSDAEGFCQVDGKKLLYFLIFPNRATWVYDPSTKAWHERASFSQGQYRQYRGRVYANAFGKHLVGDPQTGDIWEMSQEFHVDAGGAPLRRQIICPYITQHNKNLRYSQLTLDMDTGVGLDVAEDQPGYDPQLVMRYSDDRGKTWGNERQSSVGRIGETKERVIFNQNGSSRLGKVFDLVFTDPCPFSINAAYLKIGAPEQGR